MKCFRKELVLMFVQTVFIVSVVLFSVIPFSCKATEQGIEIIGGDYENPYITNIEVVDQNTLQMDFSDTVTLKKSVLSPFIENISDSSENSEILKLSPSLSAACGEYGYLESIHKVSDDGKTITFLLENEMNPGKKYEVFGMVEDAAGNSLTFCVPFVGYNARIPKLIITEAQIKYASGSVKGTQVFRAEYIELLICEDGNLAGLELWSAEDGENKKFVLPAIEVKKGEIILIHPRKKENGCINEIGDDLNLATAEHSKEGIRDLWSSQEKACYHDERDVIYILNSYNNSILDAVFYNSSDLENWKSKQMDIVKKTVREGICSSESIKDAANSSGATALKSLTRINASEIYEKVINNKGIDFPLVFNASDWAVTKVSPGEI